MSNWKYTDASHKSVFRINEDGSYSSCLVSAIASWTEEGNTPEPADTRTPTQLKAAELTLLGDRYREDLAGLQLSWLSASVSDGVSEVDRKAIIQEDITSLKSQYAADKAAILIKYA